jgi:hypothetical protein
LGVRVLYHRNRGKRLSQCFDGSEIDRLQTYYLTLDLSVRDFLDKIDENVLHSTRAGYRVWYNPLPKSGNEDENLDNDDGTAGIKPNGNGNDDDDEDEENDPLSEAVRQRRRPRDGPAAVDVEQQPEATSERPPEMMQIMELHSANPLVSYRGMVFRGSWAENIGTEMIFARHEPRRGLQVLRHLPDNIDLLAASSARINFKEVKLEIRGQEVKQTQTDRQWEEAATERYRQNGGIYVHVGSDKHGFRRPQANFLEDLTVLKRRRGETDAVTITTVETTRNDLFHDDLDEEQRRKKVKRDRARNRNLAELAVQDKRGTRGRGRGARRTGRAKGRGPPRGPSRAGRARPIAASVAELQQPRYDHTPSGWDELEAVPESRLSLLNEPTDSEDDSSSGESEGSD